MPSVIQLVNGPLNRSRGGPLRQAAMPWPMLNTHLDYLSDRWRLSSFEEAIGRVVRDGDRVIDLGCGSGVLGLMSLRAGASHVYAIDYTAMVTIARQTFERAGLANKATFFSVKSFLAELPETADVAVCDHVGYFGFDYGIIDLLRDARQRLLKPGGRLIPAGFKLFLSVVESTICRERVEAWSSDKVPPEFRWLSRYYINTEHAVHLAQDDLLGTPAELGYLDLYRDHPEFFSWSAELRISRDGILHGLAGWFDCKLADDVWMTNSPLSDQAINRPQAFFPIDEAVEVKAGELVKAKVVARPGDSLIAWSVEIPATGRRFTHSTLQGMVLGASDLMLYQPDRVPRLSTEGSARVTVLNYCDGRRTAREIEQAVLRDHPRLFASEGEISRFVTKVLDQDAS